MVQIRQMIDGPLPTGEAAWTMLQRLCRDPLPQGHQAGSTAAMARLMAFPPSAISSTARAGDPGLAPGGKRPLRNGKAQGPLSAHKTGQGSAPGSTSPGARDIRPASSPSVGGRIAGPAGTRQPISAAMGPASWPAHWSGLPIACLSETNPFPAELLMPATLVLQRSAPQPFSSWPVTFGPCLAKTADMAPARSRVAQLLAAWADWLLWRLQPPRIPQSASQDGSSAAAANALSGSTQSEAATQDPAPLIAPSDAQGHTAANDAMPSFAKGECADPEHHLAQDMLQDPAPASALTLTDEAVALALVRALEDNSLRVRLQDMIRDELAGEMGARFSGNLQAVIRREVASGLDDRLTHL
ncbi:hypothetical protein FA743_13015 [Paracoccus gahaiensis]|uniref:Uncharacterized protein n=1 Tax=Paracoccus gahaiensis TaxID=1706839 RepID=A0A4V5MV75_9RHOB|nr:hypothetical protein [Paracoccus gahaiensis]TJZ91118.1 hypothetical protein FA743_13015 [Paracoccus gahaiensis]